MYPTVWEVCGGSENGEEEQYRRETGCEDGGCRCVFRGDPLSPMGGGVPGLASSVDV